MVAVLPTGVCTNECRALIALSDLVDALQSASLRLCTAHYMRKCVRAFLDACTSAGWDDFMIPKFHWLVHFGNHIERWGFAVACFVHERKHKCVKRYAEDICNIKQLSQSIMYQIIASQLFDVKAEHAFDTDVGLISPSTAKKKTAAYIRTMLGIEDKVSLVSARLRAPPLTTFMQRDVALIKSSDGTTYVAAQLQLFFKIAERGTFALVDVFELEAADPAKGRVTWCKRDEPRIIDALTILKPTIWSEHTPGLLRTLIPYEFRGMKPVSG